jgi:hypothetical protein
VHEFRLDEVNKVATHIWSYAPSAMISGQSRGNAQRLPNGNTFIGWGGAGGRAIPACTEITPSGEVVYELKFDDPSIETYRAFRFTWPPTNRVESTEFELATGNSYVFTNTGVTVEVLAGGGGYNEFTVTREPYAPIYPVFPETAPRVLPVRVKMRDFAIPSITGIFSFDAVSFGFVQPTNLTIYYRPKADQGLFVPQPTGYNPVTHHLRTTQALSSTAGDCGEFIFGYPDLADVPFSPLLAEVESYRGVQTHGVVAPVLAAPGTVYPVNQELPILLSWSPKGFSRYYELEIATNPEFTSPALTEPFLTTAFYVWSNAAPDTAYLYRVKTWNNGGESDWSVGSFRTVAPAVLVAVPHGGETWERGSRHFVQWNDNIAEDTVIGLYKGGTFLRSIVTNASTSAYLWEIPLDLAVGSDYSIRISSATNGSLFDSSDLPFSIVDAPVINASSVTLFPDGNVQFSLTAPGATEATVLGSTDLVHWDELTPKVTLTDGNGAFIDAAAGLPYRFYRVRAR